MQINTIETALLNFMKSKSETSLVPLEEVAKEYFGYRSPRTIKAKLRSGEFKKAGLVVKYLHDDQPCVDINDLVKFLTKPRNVTIL